jgi:hypothetical protein
MISTIITVVGIIAAISVTIIFNKSNTEIFIALSVILGLMYYNLNTIHTNRVNNVNILFLLLVGLAGAGTEMIIIYFTTDIWKYRTPDIINIPIWLPLLWAIAGMGVLNLNDIVNLYGNKILNL